MYAYNVEYKYQRKVENHEVDLDWSFPEQFFRGTTIVLGEDIADAFNKVLVELNYRLTERSLKLNEPYSQVELVEIKLTRLYNPRVIQ